MASFFADFIMSMTVTIFLFTFLAIFTGTIWWYYYVKKEEKLVDHKDQSSSTCTNGFPDDSKEKAAKLVTVDKLDDIRDILMNQEGTPVTLHDKVLSKSKYTTWQEGDSCLFKDFLQNPSEKDALKNILLQATELLIQHLKVKSDDESVDFTEIMSVYASNIMYSAVFGRCFELDDERILKIRNELNEIIKVWPKFSVNYRQMLDMSEDQDFRGATGDFMTRMKQTIMRHTPEEDTKRQFFIDYLLLSKKDNGKSDEEFAEYLLVLFMSGYESLSKFFSSAALLLAENPEVQQQMREDMKENKTYGEFPEIFTFVDMTFQELLRMVKPVPFTTRCKDSATTKNEEQQNGCTLTKIDLAAVLENAEYWKCAEKFNPSRFLDETERLTQRDAFIPLSIGSRSCPGSTLVEMASLIFLTSIARAYRLSKPETRQSNGETCSDSSRILLRVSKIPDEAIKEDENC